MVQQLVEAGHRVIATCRNPGAAEELKAVNKGLLGGAPFTLDVASEVSINTLAAQLQGLEGLTEIDALVHNAGIAASTHPHDPVESASKAEMMRCFEVNCAGPMLLTQALLPFLERSQANTGQARVMMVGSRMGCASLVASTGEGWTSSVSYRCSKAAMHMLMRCFDAELKSRGICFTAVTPGWVRTDMGNAGGRVANLEVTESVTGLVKLLGEMESTTHGGKFFDYLGTEVAL